MEWDVGAASSGPCALRRQDPGLRSAPLRCEPGLAPYRTARERQARCPAQRSPGSLAYGGARSERRAVRPGEWVRRGRVGELGVGGGPRLVGGQAEVAAAQVLGLAVLAVAVDDEQAGSAVVRVV